MGYRVTIFEIYLPLKSPRCFGSARCDTPRSQQTGIRAPLVMAGSRRGRLMFAEVGVHVAYFCLSANTLVGFLYRKGIVGHRVVPSLCASHGRRRGRFPCLRAVVLSPQAAGSAAASSLASFVTSSVLTRLLSMSTTSKPSPAHSKRSPACGTRPSCSIASPQRVW